MQSLSSTSLNRSNSTPITNPSRKDTSHESEILRRADAVQITPGARRRRGRHIAQAHDDPGQHIVGKPCSRTYETLPPRETLRIYGGSDYAVTADGGDYTVHFVVGLSPAGPGSFLNGLF